jgi:pimeloyl-ACP methyl ester carboxylesterase
VIDSLPSSVVSLHGHRMHYVCAGHGPALLLLHGVLGSRRVWADLVADLASDYTVIAPDLFGHGESAKPRGDYSLGAFAGAVRDLLDELAVERVTPVGHSLGGGIAMQFAYLFPGRVQRLVLVSSGGLGRELSFLLRSAALPGAGLVLSGIAANWVCRHGEAVGRQLARLGVRAGPDAVEAWRGYVTLGDAESRRAFLATIRSVVDAGGQTVTARDRFYLMKDLPTLLVWGAHDRLIPISHAIAAHQQMPGSRLEVFPDAGHFPHLADPQRFATVMRDFMTADGSRQDQTARAEQPQPGRTARFGTRLRGLTGTT